MAAIEAKTTTRHLFRALLRAASYLPDEFARTYIHNHIGRRFRKASVMTPDRLKDARSALNTLQRACNGELKPLSSILHHVYGRTGRRRRELVVALLRPESKSLPPTDGTQLMEAVNIGGAEDGILVPASQRPMFDAFLRSHAANHPPESSRIKIRTLAAQIPRENIWGRPVALKRQQGIRHQWWVSTLNKLLPPLPEREWKRLRDLATGVIPFTGPPPRRVKATTMAVSAGDEAAPWTGLDVAYLKHPIRHTARPDKDRRRVAMDEHNITPRYMRRLWARVWNQTPMMSYDGETRVWTVTWGGGPSAASNGKVGEAGRQDLELFDGVDQVRPAGRRGAHRSKPAAAKGEGTELEVS